jgi:non-specific serine/threonine protein kinase
LVTLTGPGGTGKTRLALQIAADLLDDYADGVFFVSLAPISDPELVTSTIAQVLDVTEGTGEPVVERLKTKLRDTKILLVLDNFEQIVEAAPLISTLLAAAPRLKVLVTSRSGLHLRGEHEFPVPPLGLPPTGAPGGEPLPPIDRLTQYEAVRLFIERAVAVRPDFAITNDNAPAVAEICHRLDGLPLAIELAAARTRILAPQAMLAKLESRLKLLTGGARDLPARQQTLRGTIDWSYDLLDEGEKALFRRLAVFNGGRSLEAVEAVCNADGDLPVDVLDGLEALVDKSLLQQQEGVGGEPRFWMLVTIREYALEQLEQSGEAEKLRQQHAAYFVKFAEDAEPQLTGGEQTIWLARLEEEHDNLRAALGWSTSDRGGREIALRLSSSLWRFWARRGHYREGRMWIERILATGSRQDTSPALRAKGSYVAGLMARYQGDNEKAAGFYGEALALYRELGDLQGMAWSLNDLGTLAIEEGNLERVGTLWEESLRLKKALGDKRDIALTMGNLAELERWKGNDQQATSLLEEALEIQRELGDTYGMAMACNNLGYVMHNLGDYERAAFYFGQSLMLNRELGDKVHIAGCLAGLAWVAAAKGHPAAAARLLGTVEPMLEILGAVLDPSDRLPYDQNLRAVRAQLDDASWEAEQAAGRAMTLEQAVAYALEERPDDQ